MTMPAASETQDLVVKRLRRVQGQVAGILAMIESGRDITDIVTQLAAVGRALDRAGYMLLVGALQQCAAARAEGAEPAFTEEQVEKLFMTLA